jgi:hypothetical protein
VANFLLNNQIEEQFNLPLSIQAFQEYQEMQQLIQQIQIQDHSKDSWHYIWGNSTYTAAKFYHLPYRNVHWKLLHGNITTASSWKHSSLEPG